MRQAKLFLQMSIAGDSALVKTNNLSKPTQCISYKRDFIAINRTMSKSKGKDVRTNVARGRYKSKQCGEEEKQQQQF
jgi:hypothetical protein